EGGAGGGSLTAARGGDDHSATKAVYPSSAITSSISSTFVRAGSYCSLAEPISTSSTATPGVAVRRFFTARTQCSQDMPSIVSLSDSMWLIPDDSDESDRSCWR